MGSSPGPKFFGHCFVDDGDGDGSFRIARGNIATAKNRNFHCLEIIGVDYVEGNVGNFRGQQRFLTFFPNAIGLIVIAERNCGGERCGIDAGQRANARNHVAIKSCAARFVITKLAEIDGREKHAIGIESEVGALGGLQAAQEKSRNDQDDAGAGNLRDN